MVNRKLNQDGTPVGKRHSNPMLDSREYEVLFPDGSTDFVTANTIAENLYSQVDNQGNTFLILSEIIDHKSDATALTKVNGFLMSSNGRKYPKRSTRGWKLLVSWKDGTSTWIPLKDLKESNPVEVAEYAVANKIADEPAFAWWVKHVIRKRNHIIQKVRSKFWRRLHKYGIALPHTVAEALLIDKETGMTFW